MQMALTLRLSLGMVVVPLTASVVTKLLVLARLPGIGTRRSEGDYPPTVLAASYVTSRRHQPVHLQIHGPVQEKLYAHCRQVLLCIRRMVVAISNHHTAGPFDDLGHY